VSKQSSLCLSNLNSHLVSQQLPAIFVTCPAMSSPCFCIADLLRGMPSKPQYLIQPVSTSSCKTLNACWACHASVQLFVPARWCCKGLWADLVATSNLFNWLLLWFWEIGLGGLCSKDCTWQGCIMCLALEMAGKVCRQLLPCHSTDVQGMSGPLTNCLLHLGYHVRSHVTMSN